jgi:hypothetical protein
VIAVLACGPTTGEDVEQFPEVCGAPGPLRLVETAPDARIRAMRVGDRYVVHEGVPYESAPERLTSVDRCGEDLIDLTPPVEFTYSVLTVGSWLLGCGYIATEPAVLLDPHGHQPPSELFEAHCVGGPSAVDGLVAFGRRGNFTEIWHHSDPDDPSVVADLVFAQDGHPIFELPDVDCVGPGGCNYLHSPPPAATHAYTWNEADEVVFAVDVVTGVVGPSFEGIERVRPIGDPGHIVLVSTHGETYYDVREWSLLELATGVARPFGRFQGFNPVDIYPWIVGSVGAVSVGDLSAYHVERSVGGQTPVGGNTRAIAALSDDAIILAGDRFAVFWPVEGRVEEHPEAGKPWQAANVDAGVLVSTLDPEPGLWFVDADSGEVELVSRRVDDGLAARRNGVAVFVHGNGEPNEPPRVLTAVELDGTVHEIANDVDWFQLVGEGNEEVLFGVAEGERIGVWRSSLP